MVQEIRRIVAEVVNKLDACGDHRDRQCDRMWSRACAFEMTVEGFAGQAEGLAGRWESERVSAVAGVVARPSTVSGGGEIGAEAAGEGEGEGGESSQGQGSRQGRRPGQRQGRQRKISW